MAGKGRANSSGRLPRMRTLRDALDGEPPVYGAVTPGESDESPLLGGPPPSRDLAEIVGNIVMGASDGFTVPFALAAGLTSKESSTRIIVIAVVAELAAGFIAMGLGGYMSAQAEESYYRAELANLLETLESEPEKVHDMIEEALVPIGVSQADIDKVFERMKASPSRGARFLMTQRVDGHPDGGSAFRSAAEVGLSYVFAGALPMIPYLVFDDSAHALKWSIAVGLVAMFVFGWGKAVLLGGDRTKSALQTMLLGAFAATVSYILADMFE